MKNRPSARQYCVIVTGSIAWAGCATDALAEPVASAHPRVSESALDVMATSPYCRAAGTLDAETVFTMLVERYRRLEAYSDQVVVTWRTIDDAFPEDVDEVNMTMDCQATNEKLTVQTSGGTFWRSLGIHVPFRATPETTRMANDVEYYLAPHMALKFSDRPLEQLNAERGRSLEARQLTEVTINDRRMVQLDLNVRTTESASPSPSGTDTPAAPTGTPAASTMSLYINPDSMLVERVDRREQLDDGRTQTTTLDITPTAHRDVHDDAVGGAPDETTHEAPSAAPTGPMTPAPPTGVLERTDGDGRSVPAESPDVVDQPEPADAGAMPPPF
ncbi:MAG: hypothetical protein KC983_07450 [Phycisphaerales bacterium]|nr:hypothetical protein [Phycisphaerales bacterium]